MRKKMILIAVAAGLLALPAFAQTNTFPSSGNVGIGITSPIAKFHLVHSEGLLGYFERSGGARLKISGDTLNSYFGTETNSNLGIFTNDITRMTIVANGNIGIGTTSPAYKLDVAGNGYYSGHLSIGTTYNGHAANIAGNIYAIGGHVYVNDGHGYTNSNGNTGIYPHSTEGIILKVAGIEYSRISSLGNVGIGTTTPSEKLSVNGKIRAKEVKVEASGWPDYVFEPSYVLPDLKATEQFIKKHKHLPEIPPATEVEQEGISLGEMNAKLLKKIEELTLYLIEMKKENEKQMGEQGAKIKDLQKEINQLKSKN